MHVHVGFERASDSWGRLSGPAPMYGRLIRPHTTHMPLGEDRKN